MTIITPYALSMTLSNVPADSVTPVYDAGTIYAAGSYVQHDERIFRAVQETTGQPPTIEDETYWLYKERTNRYAWDDEKIETKTSNADLVYMEFEKPSGMNVISFFGLSGATLRVAVVAYGAEVFSDTVSLKYRHANGWDDFFFDNSFTRVGAVHVNIPYTADPDAYLSVAIIHEGATAEVGKIVAGRYRRLAATLAQPSAKIIDYSSVTTDDFGNTSFKKGASAKLITCQMFFETNSFDFVYSELRELRATPTVYLADDRETNAAATFQAFAYFDEMELTWSAGISEGTMTLRGLI